MSAHTPGPWTAMRYEAGDKEIVVIGNTKMYGNAPVALIPHDDCDHAEAKKNARLIAAAPDLLAACKYMEAALRGAIDLRAAPMFEDEKAALQDARAAIAKAGK